jgi:hypothetical protein
MLTMADILKLFLTIHIIGLATSAGGVVTGYLNLKRVWRFSAIGHINASQLQILLILLASRWYVWVGLGLSIISGAAMMHMAYSAFMGQLWFQVKLVAILIIVSTEVARGIYVRKARKMIANQPAVSAEVISLKSIIDVLSFIQIVSFLLIFVLAVFRFDR